MNDDERDFFAAIVAEPDDDRPRLVFADWLDDRGDPRGEFIRVQCRMASLGADDPAYATLLARSGALIEEHGREWAGFLSERFSIPNTWVAYERGLVHRITTDCRDGGFRPSELLSAVPTVRELHAYGFGTGHVPAEAIVDLVGCPEAARLQRLWIGSADLLESETRAIAASPYLGGLVELGTGDCRLHDDGVARISRSSALPNLRTWKLTDNGLTDDAAAALAVAPELRHLESVTFGHSSVSARDECQVSIVGFRRLAESEMLTALQTIWVLSLSADHDLPDDREEWLTGSPASDEDRLVRLVHRVESIW